MPRITAWKAPGRSKPPRNLGLSFDVPTLVRLVADAFEYEWLPDVTETVEPWTSGNEFSVTSPRADPPSPAQWVEALARHGVDATWRIYDGPAQPPERVPADYVGWFLERPSRLNEHHGGVFVRYIGEHGCKLALTMERHQADNQLWQAASRSAASMFPNGEFRTGNCQFTADQWLTHLETITD